VVPGPLAGVRVVEIATVVAAPGAARYLADFGADVIKVESPAGDSTRTMGWTGPGETDSYFWKLVNRNKRILTLDLKQKADQDALWALLDGASVLIENMRPGKLEALGFGPQRLHERNPSLVVTRVSGFGQDGPYATRPGFATIAEAMSGFADLLGEPDGGPLLPPIALTDEVTALVGAFATLVAVRHAEATGEGQVVDVNLLTSMFQLMGPLPSAYAHMGYLQPRLGSGLTYTVPRGTYRCADGVWVAISASSAGVAARLLELIGLGGDPRFSTFQGRTENREALESAVRDWVAQRPVAEVLAEVQRVDAAIARVQSMADVFADPHVQARGMIADVGGTVMQSLVAGLSLTPGRLACPGPSRDADGPAIRAALTQGGPDAAWRPRPAGR
jgi:crotonobetainyl-CoA:carnitine CoA-transferase CaiB-like acyl-CoA transferase